MGLGVLDDTKLANVPGTAILGAKSSQDATDIDDLKQPKKHGDIILIPQPSDSPNDPLNWSPTWKYTAMILLGLTSGVTTSLGPMLTPGLQIIAMDFNVDISLVSTFLVGTLVFFTGFTTFFTAAGASIWGKRPMFFWSTLILLLTNFWGLFASSFVSLSAMRITQGIASAPLETLVTSTVSDLFFVHQRGLWLSAWNMFIASGVLAGQVIAGFIITSLGYKWTFGMSGFIFCLLLPAIYFFVPETAYNPKTDPNNQVKTEYEPEEKIGVRVEISSFSDDLPPRKKSYRQMLAIHSGRVSDESFWRQAIKPVKLVAYPAVVFNTIVFGSFFAWLISLSLVSVTAFSQPPYNLNPAQIGLTNIPLLLAGLIVTPLSGLMVDWVTKTMARVNNGVFEPEFRLIPIAVAVVLSSVGFLGYGLSVEAGAPLAIPVTFLTIHSMSIPFVAQPSFAYTIDCHPHDANQAFVTINFFKAIFSFLASTFISKWYMAVGSRTMFVTIFYINFGICSLTIPMYILGKRMRSALARSKTLSNNPL